MLKARIKNEAYYGDGRKRWLATFLENGRRAAPIRQAIVTPAKMITLRRVDTPGLPNSDAVDFESVAMLARPVRSAGSGTLSRSVGDCLHDRISVVVYHHAKYSSIG
jgi:hypothetical protein